MPVTVRNVAREKLEQGQLSLGVGVRMTRSVEIAKAMAVAGFDWLFLDMEHGVMSLEACAQISTAALDAGIAPIARVPNGEYAIATRALDNGALGIVVPHVDTAAEAREIVNRLKYPPVGHRSQCEGQGFDPPRLHQINEKQNFKGKKGERAIQLPSRASWLRRMPISMANRPLLRCAGSETSPV